MSFIIFPSQAELSGDEATLQVLEAAEAKVGDIVSRELEQLAERQIEQQAALDVKQAEEVLTLEKELTTEEHTAGQQVTDQIEEQKLKVGGVHQQMRFPNQSLNDLFLKLKQRANVEKRRRRSDAIFFLSVDRSKEGGL